MDLTQQRISEIASLQKQIRLLSIVLFGACVLLVALLIHAMLSSNSNAGWPDLSANTLQAKRIVLMTDDGKPAGLLRVIDGSSGIALLDSKGKVRILLTTAKNSGLIHLTSEGDSEETFIRNGLITMGAEQTGGILIQSPPASGPSVKVFDSSGYTGSIGRSVVRNASDGTVSETSAASLMGSSKERASSWSLLSQQRLEPSPAGHPSEPLSTK